MATIKNTTTINVGEDVEKKGTLIHFCWECKLVQPLWKTVSNISQVTIKAPPQPYLLHHYSQ
jgi:hypothetical protein